MWGADGGVMNSSAAFFYGLIKNEHTRIVQPAKIYMHLFCTDTKCSLEDQPVEIDDKGRMARKGEETLRNQCD